ncbi:uncharacterized protein TRIVIDRAFT_34151 [Trichoderma virens Gv29-8]|uniref:BTB domain-containing protein n=1 Tax=Hypocrea virens (strain Gv29-8 / FGSC 10586) TaxID=413071 RepID=G9MFD9_HYPVG|nr:uncharacterized protein TRIVIDRAFT_34151 [Trichoderma virens Gv29-8]EHK27105.1 hypothetical protein TRIVIDRAFT_34151 [Trichoderma virens Gv29-8]
MQPIVHEIDPTGDTLFILRKPDAPFAVDRSFVQWPRALPQYWTPEMQQNEQHLANCALAPPRTVTWNPEMHMRLSSKHLCLASEYFQKMMANDWRETNAENGYSYTITAEDWDKKALLLLMNIIHGQTHKVDRFINLEMLAKIAVLVDYYQCHQAVQFFANSWISQLRQPLPSSYGRDLLLRLFVSYVFSETYTFHTLTKTIIYESRGSIHTLGLPIPQKMIGKFQ